MKKRARIITFMEILEALLQEPMIPNRLAQTCNINFGRLGEFTGMLESKGLVRRETRDEHEVLLITEEGVKLLRDWKKIWEKFQV